MKTIEHPKIGVGLLVIKGDKVLLGKRRTPHADGEYGGPGGHFEHLESLEGAILRELAEEAGPKLKVDDLQFLALSNMTRYAPKHFVVVSFIAKWVSGEPEIMEANSTESWGWYDLDNLPGPLYAATANDIEAYRSGKNYFDDAKGR